MDLKVNTREFDRTLAASEKRLTSFERVAADATDITPKFNATGFNRTLAAQEKKLDQFGRRAKDSTTIAPSLDNRAMSRSLTDATRRVDTWAKDAQAKTKLAPSFDSRAMDRSLRTATQKVVSWARDTSREARITPQVDQTALMRTLGDSKRKITSFSEDMSRVLKMAPSLDMRALDRSLSQASGNVRGFVSDMKKSLAQPFTARVRVDTDDGKADADSLQTTLFKLDDYNATASVEVRGSSVAQDHTDSVSDALSSIDGTRATGSLDIDGAASSLIALNRVDDGLDEIDGRTANFNISGDNLAATSAQVGEVAQKFDLLGATLQRLSVFSMPAIFGGIAGAAPVLASTTLALGGLVGALGQGAAGFYAFGAASYAAVATGLKIFTASVTAAVGGASAVRDGFAGAASAVYGAEDAVKEATKAVNAAVPGTRAYAVATAELRSAQDELNKAKLEEQRLNILNTPAVRSFNAALDEQKIALTEIQAELGNRVLPNLEKMMGIGTRLAPAILPSVYEIAEGVSFLGADFGELLTTTSNMARIEQIMSGISQVTFHAALGVGNLVMAALPIGSMMIPTVQDLAVSFGQATSSLNQWLDSKEGILATARTFVLLKERAGQSVQIVKNLASGLFNVFSALGESGVSGQMMAGLVRLSGGFANIAREGSRSRQEIIQFAQAGMPIVRAVGAIVAETGRAFLDMARNMQSVKVAGSDMSVVEATLLAIKDAIAPLSQMMQDTFVALGPMLPDLIEGLAGLASTFAGTSPVLESYLGFINDALRVFNGLPQPVKNAAANIAAFGAIAETSGGTDIIGMISNLVQMRLAFLQTSAMAGRQVGVFNLLPGAYGKTRAAAASAAGGSGQLAAAQGRVSSAATSSVGAMNSAAGAAMRKAQAERGAAVAGNSLATAQGRVGAMSKTSATGMGTATAAAGRNATATGKVATSSRAASAALTATGVAAAGAGPRVAGVGTSAAKAGTGLAAGASKAGIFSRFGGVLVKVLGGLALAFTGLSLPVTLAVAAIAGAAYLIYRNWSRIRPLFDPIVSIFQRTWTVLKGLGSFISGVFTGNITQARTAFVSLPPAIQPIAKFLGATLMAAKRLAGEGFQFLQEKAALLKGWWTENLPLMRQTATTVFNGIKAVVGPSIQSTVAVVKAVWSGLVAFWNTNNRQLIAIAKSVWSIIKTTVGGGIRIIGNLLKAGMQIINGDFSGAWRSLGRVVDIAFGMIQNAAKQGLNILGNVLQIGWNTVKAITVSVWRNAVPDTIRDGISSIVNTVREKVALVRTILTTGWNIISAVTKRVWFGIKQIFSGVWTAIKGIFSGNLSQITDGLKQAFGGWRVATEAIGKGLRALWNLFWAGLKALFGNALSGLADRVKSWGNSIREGWTTLTTQARETWSNFWSGLSERFSSALSGIMERVQGWGENFRSFVSETTEAIRSRFSEFWDGVTEMWSNRLSDLRENIESWGRNVREFFTSWGEGIREAWSNIWTSLWNRWEEARDNLRSGFQSFLSNATGWFKEGFASIGRAMVDALQGPIDKVRYFLGFLVGGIARVLNFLGADDMAAGAEDLSGDLKAPMSSYAKGGIATEAPVEYFATGGVGGLGTSGAHERVHVWNENAGNEAYIKENRPTKEQLPYLQTAADWHGFGLVKLNQMKTPGESLHTAEAMSNRVGVSESKFYPSGPPPADYGYHPAKIAPGAVAKFAAGGLVDEIQSYPPWPGVPVDYVARIASYISEKFGVSDIGGYRPADAHSEHSTGRALDIMTYEDMSKGWDIANWLTENAGPVGLQWAIFAQKINSGAGWEGMPDRGDPTQNHMDHVHSFHTGGPNGEAGFASSGAGTGGGSSGGGFDWVGAATTMFKAAMATVPFPDLGIGPLGEALGSYAKGPLTDKAIEFITGLAQKKGGSSGAGSSASGPFSPVKPGAPLPTNPTILDAVAAGGWPTNLQKDASSVVWLESKGNVKAAPSELGGVGYYNKDSNYYAGDPSIGLMQVIASYAQSLGVGGGSLAGAQQAMMDPATNTSVGYSLYKERGFDPWTTQELMGTGYGHEHDPLQNYTPKSYSTSGDADRNPSGGNAVAFGRGGLAMYETGGMIPGMAGEMKNLIAHAGEIVLPRGVSKSFMVFSENLNEFARRVPGTQVQGGPVAPGVRQAVDRYIVAESSRRVQMAQDSIQSRRVSGPNSTTNLIQNGQDMRQDMDRMIQTFKTELEELRRENRRLNDEPGQVKISNVKEIERAMKLAALASQMSEAGKEIQDENFAESLAEFKKLLGELLNNAD